MKHLFTAFVCCISFSFLWMSCFDEEYVPADTSKLEFSLDTLRFDTVFTSIGSATRLFKIYNRSTENLTIQSLKLGKGEASSFRINVDGVSGHEINDLPILANDSIYAFVEVTVDPDAPLSVSPFVITEPFVISDDRGGTKMITLEAWGQNANYIPSRDAAGRLIGLSCDNGNVIWNDPKPYVVYGLIFIDSCNLIIPPGARVYFHGGLSRFEGTIYNDGGLFFLPSATLNVLGTVDQPVTFQGDRLEPSFDDEPGQWAGIRFLEGSHNNRLEHAVIRNSAVGIRVDSSASLELESCIIENTSGIGLLGLNAEIRADNCLIYSNGQQSVAMIGGGDYRLRHVTLGNYQNDASALYMDNFICLNSDCSEALIDKLSVNIQNSIIMGSNDDELDIIDYLEGAEPDLMDITIENSIIRVKKLKEAIDISTFCVGCIEYMGEPLFADHDLYDFQLDSMSVARDLGFPSDVQTDILDNNRSSTAPDLGCYEVDF